jgi:L-iditol 2-dehydrogenase
VIGDPASRLELATDWGATDTISVSDLADPDTRVQAVRELTAGHGGEVVMEFSGARTAFSEGLQMVRRGGRYVVAGQVGPHEVTIRPTDITKGHLSILGSFSASEAQYWRAIQFLSRTKDRFDFDRLLSNRFGLDEATSALASMQSLREIKPVLVPAGS